MPAIQRILMTTDLSDNSFEAWPLACELAEKHGASITILSVVETPIYLSHVNISRRIMEDQRFLELLRETEPVVRERILESVEGSAITPEVAVVHAGAPADEIVRQAQKLECDLIVMATHGRKGISHFFLGSVAEKVTRTSPVPVLVVRNSSPATAA